MIKKILYRLTPITWIKYLEDKFLRDFMFAYRTKKSLLFCWFINKIIFMFPENEKMKAYAYIGKYGETHYPYKYEQKYKHLNVEYGYDDEKDMSFVLHNNNRLYLQKGHLKNVQSLLSYYKSLLIEQDVNSAHRYVINYSSLTDKVLLDVGAAEGVFSLDVIKYAKHVYLFECETEWIELLNATFEPWKEKITIINKYISSYTDSKNITIDDFVDENNLTNVFLKMDIEGAETEALLGSNRTFNNLDHIDFAICLYHKKNDLLTICRFLKDHNCPYIINQGYLFMEHTLRRGVVRSLRS